MPQAFTRFSAGETEKPEIARNYYTVLFVILIAGLLVSFLFFCFSGFISRSFIKTEAAVLPLLHVASLPFYVILMPKLVELWERNDDYTLKKVLSYSNKLPLLACIPTVLGYAVLYAPILRLLTGESIQVPVLLIPLICIGYIFFYIGGFYSSVFSLVKRTKYTTAGYAIGAIANLAGNICLVPVIGIIGAAITTMLTFLIQMVYFMRKSKKFYDINLNWDYLWKCILASVLLYLLLIARKPPLSYYGDSILVLASILIGACVYLVILYLLGVYKKEEIDMIRDLIS